LAKARLATARGTDKTPNNFGYRLLNVNEMNVGGRVARPNLRELNKNISAFPLVRLSKEMFYNTS
jgi:hypothetical protein